MQLLNLSRMCWVGGLFLFPWVREMWSPIPQFWPDSGCMILSLTELKHGLGLLWIQLTKRALVQLSSFCQSLSFTSCFELCFKALVVLPEMLNTTWVPS